MDLNILLATKMIKKLDLYICFSQKMTGYREDCDDTKFMSFLMQDHELLEKNNKIWEKNIDSLKREFDSKPVYNKKYLKAIIKYHERKINTNFHNNKKPK